MKFLKLLTFLIALFWVSIAQSAPSTSAFIIGTSFPHNNGGTGREAYGADKRLAFGYLAMESKTITSFRFCVYYRAGSNQTSTDGEVKVYASTVDGAIDYAGGALATATFDPTSSGCKTTTTISLAIGAGEQVWIVVANANPTSKTDNFFAILITPEGLTGFGGGGIAYSNSLLGTSYQESNDGGSTWTSYSRPASSAYRINFSDSTYYGYPMTEYDSPSNPVNAADRVYSTREVGNKFTTPAGTDLNVRCVSFLQNRIGNPTHSSLQSSIFSTINS